MYDNTLGPNKQHESINDVGELFYAGKLAKLHYVDDPLPRRDVRVALQKDDEVSRRDYGGDDLVLKQTRSLLIDRSEPPVPRQI